jgi:hypothetical protein
MNFPIRSSGWTNLSMTEEVTLALSSCRRGAAEKGRRVALQP